jgi:hypothetical protein
MNSSPSHEAQPSSNKFAPLIDVGDDFVKPVLDALLYEHIIAFVSKVPADAPTSRIFVEHRSLPIARVVLTNRMPQLAAEILEDSAGTPSAASNLSTDEVDAAWTQLVQGLQGPNPEHDAAPMLDESDDDEEPSGSGLSSRLVRSAATPGPRDFSLPDPDELLESEDGFVPPEPPPLPRPSHPADKWGWGAAIGGPVLLVGSTMLGLPTWIGGIGVAAFIAGFVTLVARMRNERDSGDDGAVV